MGTAYAQERVGAGRVEVGAFPGGGIFFGQTTDKTGPNFGDYALGASVTVNFNKWVGAEGEIGGGIGIRLARCEHTERPVIFSARCNAIDRYLLDAVTAGLHSHF